MSVTTWATAASGTSDPRASNWRRVGRTPALPRVWPPADVAVSSLGKTACSPSDSLGANLSCRARRPVKLKREPRTAQVCLPWLRAERCDRASTEKKSRSDMSKGVSDDSSSSRSANLACVSADSSGIQRSLGVRLHGRRLQFRTGQGYGFASFGRRNGLFFNLIGTPCLPLPGATVERRADRSVEIDEMVATSDGIAMGQGRRTAR